MKPASSLTRLAGVGAVLVLTGCVSAAGNAPAVALSAPRERGALSGVRSRVGYLGAINPDCSSLGESRPQVVLAPANGEVSFAPGEEFGYFPPSNVRAKCNDRRVPMLLVFYQSKLGFHGKDHFGLQVLSPSGRRYAREYDVIVP